MYVINHHIGHPTFSSLFHPSLDSTSQSVNFNEWSSTVPMDPQESMNETCIVPFSFARVTVIFIAVQDNIRILLGRELGIHIVHIQLLTLRDNQDKATTDTLTRAIIEYERFRQLHWSFRQFRIILTGPNRMTITNWGHVQPLRSIT